MKKLTNFFTMLNFMVVYILLPFLEIAYFVWRYKNGKEIKNGVYKIFYIVSYFKKYKKMTI